MGLPMARCLLRDGFDILGFDVRPLSEFGHFARHMTYDAEEFASRVDVVISAVRDERQTYDLLFEQQGVFAGVNVPSRLVIMSTLSPRVLPRISDNLPDATVLLDAPMSGAPNRAQSGELTFMIGGPEETYLELRPVFECLGQFIHYLGDTGSGMTCKVLNNMVAASSIVAVRKALAASETLGLDPHRLLDVMRSSSGGTWYGNHFDDISWAREGYAPENTIAILEKDVKAYLDAVQDIGDNDKDFEHSVIEALIHFIPLEKP